jgi:carbamate kinase
MGDTSHETGTDPIVVALGGNTLLGAHGLGSIDEQLDVIAQTARQIADAIQAGYDVVLTHGNGPQVGNLLLQQERVSETPALPLDVLVAETQAQIGYLLQQALDNELTDSPDFVTVVTQVVVDADDPAFQNPSDRSTRKRKPRRNHSRRSAYRVVTARTVVSFHLPSPSNSSKEGNSLASWSEGTS